MKVVNLAEKLSTFTEHWQPRTVGELNGHDLMVVKVQGARRAAKAAQCDSVCVLGNQLRSHVGC